MALFHFAVPVSQRVQCHDPDPDNFKWKGAVVQVIKYTCVGHVLRQRSAGYWISSFPILHLCVVYIQGQLRSFFLFTAELKSAPAAPIASVPLSCVLVYMLWKSPASKFTSRLSRHRFLLIVCSFVTLLVWWRTAVECDYIIEAICYNKNVYLGGV